MQREEKQLECFLDNSLTKLNDLKKALGQMIHKIEFEHETINWPSFLDNFAIISSHLAGLSKLLALEYTPPIKNFAVLPLLLTPDFDEHLSKITENRLSTFSAEAVPDYLRTKPDPAAENRMNLHEAKANAITSEASSKQVAQYNKIVTHVNDLISKARDEWDLEGMHRNARMETCNQNDTHLLVKAVGMGVGLKGIGNIPPSGMIGMATMQPRVPGPVQMSSQSPGIQVGKLPSSIKTNIKSAQLHPYR